METKDVVIGNKYVPHDKTPPVDCGIEAWDEFINDPNDCCSRFFRKHGYLIAKDIPDDPDIPENVVFLGCEGTRTSDNFYFYPSDFEPYVEPEAEEIESREGQGE
jgi:hypothetical protein